MGWIKRVNLVGHTSGRHIVTSLDFRIAWTWDKMGEMISGSDNNFQKRFIKFKFKVERIDNKGVTQEIYQELQ